MDKKKENPDGIKAELKAKEQELGSDAVAEQLAEGVKDKLAEGAEKAEKAEDAAKEEEKAEAEPKSSEAEEVKADPEGVPKEEAAPKETDEAPKTASTLEARELEVARREAELNRRDLEAEAKKLLQEKKLPEELLPFIVKGSVDETKGSIEALAKIIASLKEVALTEAMKGSSPSGDKGNVGTGTATMEQIIGAGLGLRG